MLDGVNDQSQLLGDPVDKSVKCTVSNVVGLRLLAEKSASNTDIDTSCILRISVSLSNIWTSLIV